jgi:hypothetical protein
MDNPEALITYIVEPPSARICSRSTLYLGTCYVYTSALVTGMKNTAALVARHRQMTHVTDASRVPQSVARHAQFSAVSTSQ